MTINRPFADCKTDELHLADAVQSFGAMVVLDPDDIVAAVSANAEAFLGATPQDLLGTDARESLPPGVDLDAMRSMAAGARGGGPIRLRLQTVEVGGRDLTTAVHAREGTMILEFEDPGDVDASHGVAAEAVQDLTDSLEEISSPEATASLLMEAIADLVGFDRVMLYRFLPGWHGEVLDERLAPGVEGYLGLRFPEGDIPANARRLYVAKRQRIIADASAPTVPVHGVRDGMTLDLTGSELRAVHPTHLEYLANMGVTSSFSVSIVVEGQLWGMIACHHFTPRRIGFVARRTCEVLATIASLRIASLERAEHMRRMERHVVTLDRTAADLDESRDGRLVELMPHLMQMLQADGAVGRIGEHTCQEGDVPDGTAGVRLRRVVESWPADSVTAGAEVPTELADHPEAVRHASGVLHVPFGEDAYITFLRREEVETVAWAGRPPDSEAADAAAGPLGPRTSFAIWREATRGQARPWTSADLEVAQLMRAMLLDRRTRIELERRASTDGLTGLANHTAFDEALSEAVADPRQAGKAVLAIDLDRFKDVNDAYGHLAGDEVLKEAANRLRAAVRDDDLAARVGGDEFAVLLRGVADAAALATKAERLVLSLAAPYRVKDQEVEIGASVGAAFLATAGGTVEEVLARADEALYAAKGAGRGRYALAGVDDGGVGSG